MSSRRAEPHAAEHRESLFGRGRPLPGALRGRLEALFGCGLGSVRLHIGPEPATHGALAFAEGEHLCFLPGTLDLGTPRGIERLAHELAHVVQQRAGRVPAASRSGPVVEDAALEAEARAVGRHCAARFHSGGDAALSLPASYRPAEAVAVRRSAPAPGTRVRQCLRSSADSFGDFTDAAWTYLDGLGELKAAKDVKRLYKLAAGYNFYNAPAKQPLGGLALNLQMVRFLQSSIGRTVKVQTGDHWPAVGAQEYISYYLDVVDGLHPGEPYLADTITGSYLHVYPRAGLHANTDWRIGVNLKPNQLGGAMANLTAVLDRYPDINHMKFSAPTLVSKADSLIVYMHYDANTYDAIQEAVLQAVGGFQLQDGFGAIWNEVGPGIAEAAEPPKNGGSFTDYRAVVTYLAYLYFLNLLSVDEHTKDNFVAYVGGCFELFGMPPAQPHMQGAVTASTANVRTFFKIKALCDGKAPDAYANRTLQPR